MDVATENDVPVREEQNVAQRLNINYKSIPIGRMENTEIKMKNFSRHNVETSLYLLMLLTDDSTIIQENQGKCLSMEQLKNEPSFTYLPLSQSTLMTKCVAEQVLINWWEILGNLLFGC